MATTRQLERRHRQFLQPASLHEHHSPSSSAVVRDAAGGARCSWTLRSGSCHGAPALGVQPLSIRASRPDVIIGTNGSMLSLCKEARRWSEILYILRPTCGLEARRNRHLSLLPQNRSAPGGVLWRCHARWKQTPNLLGVRSSRNRSNRCGTVDQSRPRGLRIRRRYLPLLLEALPASHQAHRHQSHRLRFS